MNEYAVYTMPVIVLDVDDLLADTVPVWLQAYNKVSGDCLTPDMILTYDIQRYVLPLWRDKMMDIYNELPYVTVPPVDGAVEGVRTLREEGFPLLFATAPNGANDNPMRKFRWLVGNDITRDIDEFAILSNKRRLHADAIVDDKPSTVAAFFGKGFLFDRSWNRTITTLDRCVGWDEVIRKVTHYDFCRPAKTQ